MRAGHDCDRDGCSDGKVRFFHHGPNAEELAAADRAIALHDSGNGDGECPLSQRVDGLLHTWRFDGDDPYIICVWCDERRDALSGQVLSRGRTATRSQRVGPAMLPSIREQP